MEAKRWFESRTLWLNAIAVALIVAQALQGQAWLDPEYQVLIVAILNAILRLITNKPLSK